jgi:hypothetical protein
MDKRDEAEEFFYIAGKQITVFSLNGLYIV